MDYSDFKLLQLLLFFGVALGIGVWQLLSVRRSLQRDREEASKTAFRSAQIGASDRNEALRDHESAAAALEQRDRQEASETASRSAQIGASDRNEALRDHECAATELEKRPDAPK